MKRQIVLVFLIIGSALALLGYHFVEKPTREIKGKTIILQPLGDFPESLSNSLCARLKEQITSQVIIVKPMSLPQSAYNKSKRAYRADSLLNYLSAKITKKNTIVIGLTTKDLNATRGNISDCAIMGLARTSGNTAVVSSYRLTRRSSDSKKYKDQLLKLVIHEFGHTLGLQHCYEDSACYMGDALSGASLDKFQDFCSECKPYFQEQLSKFQ